MRGVAWSLLLLLGCRGGASSSAGAGSGGSGGSAAAPTGLAEVGPHPDYPTARSAGTERIFLLEEPDRGPPVDLAFTATTTGLAATTHAHCELTAGTVACGPEAPAAAARWRLHRRGPHVEVAEQLWLDGHVAAQYAFVRGPDGALQRRVELDTYGRVVEELRFTGERFAARRRSGANGLPGCGAMGFALDAAGAVTELRCLQWSGAPMRDTTGVAITRYTRDARGLVIAEARFDAAGAPVVGIDGIHAMMFERDAAGRVTRLLQRGIDGGPATDGAGCSAYASAFTEGGDLARRTCLDTAYAPRARADGVTTTGFTYDARGCLLTEGAYDGNDLRIADVRGVHARRTRRDERCAAVETSCVDIGYAPVPCGPGAPARRAVTLDAEGRVIGERAYDAEGRQRGDARYGAAELRFAYDARDRLVAESCHDEGGAPIECAGTGVHRYVHQHDDAGRIVAKTYVNDRGGLTRSLGAARVEWRHDSYDHLVEVQAFDVEGRSTDILGAAIMRQYYDERHRLFARVMLDAAGQPAAYTGCYTGITCPAGAWHALRIVRGGGMVTANQFFDVAGQLIHTVDCAAAPCLQ